MRIRKLLSDSAVYGITGYLTIISGILLTPLYTRIFTKEEYGIMDLFNTWNTFAIAIIPLGLIQAITRFYPDFSKDPEQKKNFLGTILSTAVVITLSYFLIMLISKNYFISYVKADNLNEIFYHSLFLVFSGLIFTYITTILQTKFQKYSYMILTIINFLVLSILGFVFVYYYNMRLEGFYRAASITMVLTLIIGFFLIKQEIFFSFDKTVLKNLLKYSLPILSVFFLFQATNIIDRILLINFGNIEQVGIFNIGTKISGIIRIIFTAFSTAWFPLAMSIKNNSDAKETYKKIHNVFFLSGLIITTGLFIFRKELILFFAPDYLESYNTIGILGLFNFVSTCIYIYSLGLHIENRTKYLTRSAIASILANVFFSILFIYLIGTDGIAWGSLIGGIVWVLFQLYYSQKYYFINFNFSISIGTMLLLFCILFSTSSLDFFLGSDLIVGIIVKSVVMLLLILIVYLITKKFKLLDFKIVP
jgi:O-antigen/teichoic acid export membrane protein